MATPRRPLRLLAAVLVAALAGGCAAPFPPEVQAVQQRYDLQRRQLDELERLQRLGRFDEAQQLARQLDAELGQDGEGALGELLHQAQAFGEDDVLAVDDEPLFVQPLWLEVLGPEQDAWLRLPPAQREAFIAAMARMAAGDPAAARAALQRADELARAQGGADHPDRLPILARLARFEVWQRNFDPALAHVRTALTLAQHAPPQAAAHWRRHLRVLEASVRHDLGDLDGALAALEHARAAGGDPAADFVIDNDLGVLLARRGEHGAAQRAFETALAKLDTPPSSRPGLPVDLSAGLDAVLDAGLARVREETRWWQAPRLLSNLGLVRWRQGDAAAALAYFAQALEVRARFDAEDTSVRGETAALARAAVAARELDALVTLERAAPPQAPRPALQFLLERKGALLERQARAMAAIRRDADAPAAATAPPRRGGWPSLGAAQRQALAAHDARTRAENRDLLEQYRLAQDERARLEGQRPLTAEEAQARARSSAELDRRLRVMQREIEQRHVQAQLQREAAVPDPDSLRRLDPETAAARLQAQLQARNEQRERHRREQRAQLPSAVQARIPAGAVLVEMLTLRPLDPLAGAQAPPAPPRYAAWLLRRDGEPVWLDFGPAAPMDALVAELRKALSYPDSLEQARALGRRLDALLMAPVRQAMGDATSVLIAPEGQLNLIPFGALVDESGRFLVERFDFNVLSSGRDLVRPEAEPAPRGPALILADPAFGGPAPPLQAAPEGTPPQRARDFAGMAFDPLPATAVEASSIKALLPDAVLLTSTQASESALKRARGPRLLHLATHGFFLGERAPPAAARGRPALSRENPMLRSGLAFAGVGAPGSEQDDGVLTALEAAGLDLGGTRLVVLSACETGLGAVRNGEGVFGLRRAFVVAGAQTLVMSLWQVDDESTQRLMSDYYRRLAAGADRIGALRGAQLTLLADPATRHPFYWAAFIASGLGGPLR